MELERVARREKKEANQVDRFSADWRLLSARCRLSANKKKLSANDRFCVRSTLFVIDCFNFILLTLRIVSIWTSLLPRNLNKLSFSCKLPVLIYVFSLVLYIVHIRWFHSRQPCLEWLDGAERNRFSLSTHPELKLSSSFFTGIL